MYLFRKLFSPTRLPAENVRLETWQVSETSHPGIGSGWPGRLIRRWGRRGTAPGCLNMPSGIVVNKAGDVIVADTENSRIQIFSSTGKLRNIVSGKGSAPEYLNHPMGVALTPDSEERIIVTDSVNAAVKIFYQSGEFVASFNIGLIDFPYGVAVSSKQFIVVTDVCHHRVVVLYPSGGMRNFFGKYGDGIDCLDHPYYVTVNGNDDIIISDSGNSRIKITDLNGVVMKIFDMADFRLYDEHFIMLHGVAVDEDDNILIIGNNTVYLVVNNGRLWEVVLPTDDLDAPRSLAYSPLGQIVVTQYDLDKRHEITVFSFNKDDFKSLKRFPLKSLGNKNTADSIRGETYEERSISVSEQDEASGVGAQCSALESNNSQYENVSLATTDKLSKTIFRL